MVSSWCRSKQVTTTVPLEVLNSALASRIADATAEERFLRATTSVATPFRNTSHCFALSSHWIRYSTLAILSESRGRPVTPGAVLGWMAGIAKDPEEMQFPNLKPQGQFTQSHLTRLMALGVDNKGCDRASCRECQLNRQSHDGAAYNPSHCRCSHKRCGASRAHLACGGIGRMAFVQAFSTIPEIGAAIWTVIHRRGDLGERCYALSGCESRRGAVCNGTVCRARAKWARTGCI